MLTVSLFELLAGVGVAPAAEVLERVGGGDAAHARGDVVGRAARQDGTVTTVSMAVAVAARDPCPHHEVTEDAKTTRR
jgi:hypothetical protein